MASTPTPPYQTGATQTPALREAGERTFSALTFFEKLATFTAGIFLGAPTRRSVGTVASAGSVQGDAAALPVAGFVNVTGADTAKGVILPASTAGTEIVIYNNSASALKVYPPSGGTIGAGASNAAATIGARVTYRAVCVDGTNWTA